MFSFLISLMLLLITGAKHFKPIWFVGSVQRKNPARNSPAGEQGFSSEEVNAICPENALCLVPSLIVILLLLAPTVVLSPEHRTWPFDV